MAEGGALRELLALFSIDVPTEELEHGKKEIQGLIGGIKKLGEVVAEAFAVHLVKEFFEEQIEGAAHIQDLANRLDISATSLTEFGQVAQQAGVDLDSAAHSLGFLSMNLGKARLQGGETAAAFQKLGVHTKNADGSSRDLLDVVGDVAEGLSRLPDQQIRAAYAMQFFGRQGKDLLPILAQDKEALQEQIKEAKILSSALGDDYYAQAKKAREAGEGFGDAMTVIKAKITQAVLPTIIRTLGWMKKQALSFIDLTKRTYILKTGMIALSVVAGVKLVSSLMKVFKVLGLLKPTIGETVVAMLEFAAPLLIAAGLYLVFDEFYTLMKGGKTIIGDTLNELTGDTEASAKAALFLRAGWSDAVDGAKDFAAILAGVLIPILYSVWEVCVGLGNVLADVFTGNFGAVAGDIKASTEKISDAIEAGKKTISDAWNEPVVKGSAVDALQKKLAQGANPTALNDSANGKTRQPLLIQRGNGPTKAASDSPQAATALKAFKVEQKDAATFRPPQGLQSPGQKASAPGPVTINQTNHFAPGTDKEGADRVGKATGQGVATAQQKATNNALQGVRRQ